MIDKLHMPNANHDVDALEIHKIVNTLKCLHYFSWEVISSLTLTSTSTSTNGCKHGKVDSC